MVSAEILLQLDACFPARIYAWTNGWINTRDAGNLIPYRAHYDVNVMLYTNRKLRRDCTDKHTHFTFSSICIHCWHLPTWQPGPPQAPLSLKPSGSPSSQPNPQNPVVVSQAASYMQWHWYTQSADGPNWQPAGMKPVSFLYKSTYNRKLLLWYCENKTGAMAESSAIIRSLLTSLFLNWYQKSPRSEYAK